ncbi:MAG: hypothetical protein RI516_01550 [Spiribacter sp.]|jgi:hypothetical protein|nr:hypothetical protein [Spiribacter sp.]MDR9480991.1 hypothetical protein [Spiribacter sp.]
MRELTDDQQGCWRVEVLFASYGAFYLIFSPPGAGEPYKLAIAADSQLEAERMLAAMDETTLRQSLGQAVAFSETTELGF